MTKEERAEMPRGVTHVQEFTWNSGTCPLGDGLDLLITGVASPPDLRLLRPPIRMLPCLTLCSSA